MRSIASFALTVALAGCSASGAGTAFAPAGSGASPLSRTPLAHRDRGRVRVTIEVPRPQRHRGGKSPRWISPATKSVAFGLGNPTQSGWSPTVVDISTCPVTGGVYVCSETVEWPVGNQSAYAGAFAGTNATGSVLSEALGTVNVVEGGTNILDLPLWGVESSITETQDVMLRGGSPSSAVLSLAAYDSSGALITGAEQYEAPVNTHCGLEPVTVPACTEWTAPTAGNAMALSYDGHSVFGGVSHVSLTVNFNAYAGALHQFLAEFVPVVDLGTVVSPASLTFAGPSTPAQSVAVSGQPISSATLDGCGNASAAISGSTVTVTPAGNTTAACTLVLYGTAFGTSGWQVAVFVPIAVGASTVPLDNVYGVAAPNALEFSGASSPSKTLTITPPDGYTGSVSLASDGCLAMKSGDTPFGGPTGPNNAVPFASIAGITPSTSLATVNGAPVTFTLEPVAQGVCTLEADAGGNAIAFPVVAVGP